MRYPPVGATPPRLVKLQMYDRSSESATEQDAIDDGSSAESEATARGRSIKSETYDVDLESSDEDQEHTKKESLRKRKVTCKYSFSDVPPILRSIPIANNAVSSPQPPTSLPCPRPGAPSYRLVTARSLSERTPSHACRQGYYIRS